MMPFERHRVALLQAASIRRDLSILADHCRVRVDRWRSKLFYAHMTTMYSSRIPKEYFIWRTHISLYPRYRFIRRCRVLATSCYHTQLSQTHWRYLSFTLAHPKIPAKAPRVNRSCSLSSSFSCCLLDPDDPSESLKYPTWCVALASDPPSCESSLPQRTYVSITAVLANNAIRVTRLLQHR